MITLAEIRAQYPTPMRATDSHEIDEPGQYCVGGAFCRAVTAGLRQGFPTHVLIGRKLQTQNPALSDELAARFGLAIIGHNEARDFDSAWKLLGAALKWRPLEVQS
jgi:hypothetical protein